MRKALVMPNLRINFPPDSPEDDLIKRKVETKTRMIKSDDDTKYIAQTIRSTTGISTPGEYAAKHDPSITSKIHKTEHTITAGHFKMFNPPPLLGEEIKLTSAR